MSVPLVSLRQVTVTLQGVRALDHVDFNLFPGRHMALLGPNGSGKSTLLRILHGESWPDQRDGGEVVWFDPRVRDEQGKPLADTTPLTGRAMCAVVSPALQEMYMRQGWHVSGEEVVLSGLHDGYMLYGDATTEECEAAGSLVRELGAPELLGKDASTLSQGQLRLLLLARALIQRPVLLLLDEAADGLDKKARQAFFRALDTVVTAPDAPTVVFASHRTGHDGEVPDFCRLIGRMDAGRLIELCDRDVSDCLPPEGPANELSEFSSSLLSPCTGGEAARGVSFAFHNATVFIDRQEVLHSITWSVEPGQQWLLAGGNGAGKSTLLRALMGEELIAAGGSLRRTLVGTNDGPRELTLLSDVQRHISLVSDRLQALYSHDDNALQVVLSGLDGGIGIHREFSEYERAEAVRCLRLTGMNNLAQRRFRALSTGQGRRVLLARALAGAPALLLLDEPFSGLDATSRRSMMELISLLMRGGTQIILISHREDDILPGLTHRAVMWDGRIIRAETLPDSA